MFLSFLFNVLRLMLISMFTDNKSTISSLKYIYLFLSPAMVSLSPPLLFRHIVLISAASFTSAGEISVLLRWKFTVAKKMATFRFYQNALRVLSKNTWEKMTRSKANGLKFQHKREIVELSLSALQKTLVCLYKRFETAVHSGKIDIRHLFCYGELAWYCRGN